MQDLIEILVCPENKSPLRYAAQDQLDRLNALVTQKSLKNRGGQPVLEKIESGLIREDGKVLYPIRNQIPMLVKDEGIEVPA